MKTDIEISEECNIKDIKTIASILNLKEDDIECFGKYKAKINKEYNKIKQIDGKLILVTSMNPTPFGEGKTTMSIGISDSLNSLNKKSVVVLREPSLGPVFGIKGGATGGGYSQVVPMEDINLHFTGDLHAIESANNLLCAIIDNHIYQGNALDIKKVAFNRCVDLNDRALRNIEIKYNNGYTRDEHYNITVASEIMAILCLATNLEDLKVRLGNILVGYDSKDNMIFARDLNCVGAIALLLKDAIKPNLVQTLENNPAIIHGGPFANIAHGCNSIIATKLALKSADYVVTEAGFGSDLGAEKFLDIKCPIASIKPNCIVINATIRSIKYNSGNANLDVSKENISALKLGIGNLRRHIENMCLYTNNIIVCINKFKTDTDLEIEYVKNFVKEMGIEVDVCESYLKGSPGAISLASKILNICDNKCDYKALYSFDDTIINKINIIAKKIYRAKSVIISDDIKSKINKLEQNNLGKLPICIAKTQYSFSDDAKLLGCPESFDMTITDIKVSSGAGFIVVLMGKIMTMPGLSKNAAYLNMDITNDGKISGIF